MGRKGVEVGQTNPSKNARSRLHRMLTIQSKQFFYLPFLGTSLQLWLVRSPMEQERKKTHKGNSVWLGELKKYLVWDPLLYLQSGYAKLMFPAIRVFLADYDFQVMGGGKLFQPPGPPSSFSDLLPSSIIRTLVGRNVSYRELHHHCTLHLQSALLNASNAINIIIIFLLLLASICSTFGGKGC